MFNADGEKIGDDARKYGEECLRELYDLDFEQLREYFLAARELYRYMFWWKQRE